MTVIMIVTKIGPCHVRDLVYRRRRFHRNICQDWYDLLLCPLKSFNLGLTSNISHYEG